MAKNPGRGNKGSRKNSVPNVVGLAKTTAQTQITNAGFTYTITNENTTDSNLNDTIKSQSISGGTVTPIGTDVSLVNYTFSFTPFGAFGFTPVTFGFTPFGFTPVFSFTPIDVFAFSPPTCIQADTLIDTPNGKIAAKDLKVGDEITTVSIQEVPESSPDGMYDFDYVAFVSETLTPIEKTTTIITDIVPSSRNVVMFFNGDQDKKYSHSQPMFIKKNDYYQVVPSGSIEVGDYLISVKDDGAFEEVLVEDINEVMMNTTVYQFSCEPADWFIAGGYLVHNK